MTVPTDFHLEGARGRIAVRVWADPAPRYVALLAHGYAEHSGRYQHVAERLVAHGAAVYAPDHLGHGRSEGEPALVEDIEVLVADLHAVRAIAATENPGLPVVLIGHSMGGVIALRFAQQHGAEVAALVVTDPPVGGNPAIEPLLEMDPIPEVPLDPELLSRDPAVGAAYAADPLVYHGPFPRATLESIFGATPTISDGPSLGALPTLWLQGEEDGLAIAALVGPVLEKIRGDRFDRRVYPGARHEIFNETNREEVLDDLVAFLDRHV